MGKNKMLTEYEKGFADEKSQREIAILINIAISRYLHNKEGYGKNFIQGRPCINNERSVRAVKRAASCNKGSTALQLKGISVARGVKRTIIRALKLNAA